MKKLILWLVVTIISITLITTLSLIGCKDAAAPAEEAAAPAEEAATPAEEAEEAVDEKVELVMWEQSAEWRIAAQQATIDAFVAENPNVSITIESFPFVEYLPKINSAIQAGTAVNIITIVGQWAVPLINAGLVAEIPVDVISIEELNEEYFEGPGDEAIVT